MPALPNAHGERDSDVGGVPWSGKCPAPFLDDAIRV